MEIMARVGMELDPTRIQNISNVIGKTLHESIRSATADALQKGFSVKAAAAFGQETLRYATLVETLKIRGDEARRRLNDQSLTRSERRELKGQLKRATLEERALRGRLAKEMAYTQKIADELGRREAKSFSENIDSAGEGFAKAVNDAMSGDFSQMAESFGERLKTLGTKAAMKGATSEGGLGALIGKLGPAIMGLGAIVGALAAVVKLIIDADAQTKEFNKELLSSGVAVGELTDQYGSMQKNLDLIRETFTKFSLTGESFNQTWGLTAKDSLQIIGAYAAAGQTFARITAGIQDAATQQERLKDATALTLTYAKLFNTETGQMTEQIGSWMEDLGENFNSIRDSLSGIHRAAMESGFGIKRFFSLMTQATADMSMYNVRLSETAGLLARMSKVLGPKAGAQMVTELNKGIMDVPTDVMKKVLMAGGEGKGVARYRKIETGAARRTAEDINRMLSGLKENDEAGYNRLSSIFDRFNVSLDPDKLASTYGKLTARQQAAFLADLTKVNMPGLLNKFDSLGTLLVGARGGLGGVVTGATGVTGVAKLEAALLPIQGILEEQGMGNKTLYDIWKSGDITDVLLKQLVTTTGLSMEELKNLATFQGWQLGAVANIKQRMAETAKMKGHVSQEEMDLMAKTYGVIVDQGKVYRAVLKGQNYQIGKEVDATDVEDLKSTLASAYSDGTEETISQDIALAQQQVANTTEMTMVLKQGIEAILEKIHGVTQSIFNFMLSESGAEERQKALDLIADGISKSQEDFAGAREELARLKGQLHGATSPEKSAEIKAQMAEQSRVMAESQKQVKRYDAAQKKVLSEGFSASLGEKIWGTNKTGKGMAAGALADAGLGAEQKEKLKQLPAGQQKEAAKYLAQAFVERLHEEQRHLGMDMPQAEAGKLKAALEELEKLAPQYAEATLAGKTFRPELKSEYWGMPGMGVSADRKKDLLSRAQASVPANEIIDAMDENEAKRLRKEQELREKARPKLREDLEKAVLEALLKGRTLENVDLFKAILAEAGVSDAAAQAERLYFAFLEGQGFPEELLPYLAKPAQGGEGSVEDALRRTMGLPELQDFVMQDGDARRISEADTLIGLKPGGPLASRRSDSAGGGTTNVFHLYNDAPGIVKAIATAQRAGVLGSGV